MKKAMNGFIFRGFRVSHLGYLLLGAILLLTGCGNLELGLEQNPVEKEESIVLQFDGPLTYTYTTKANIPVTRTVENEESLLLFNQFQDKNVPLNNLSILYFRISLEQELKLFFGPDPDYPVNQDGQNEISFLCNGKALECINDLKNKAQFINQNHQEDGILSSLFPLSFDKKPIAVISKRKEKLCLDEENKIVPEAGKTPNLNCQAPFGSSYHEVATGQWIETSYTLEDLKTLTKEHKRTMIMSQPEAPIRIVLKNTKYLAPAPVGGSQAPLQNNDQKSTTPQFVSQPQGAPPPAPEENPRAGACSMISSGQVTFSLPNVWLLGFGLVPLAIRRMKVKG